MKNDQNKGSNKQTDACNEKKATKEFSLFFQHNVYVDQN